MHCSIAFPPEQIVGPNLSSPILLLGASLIYKITIAESRCYAEQLYTTIMEQVVITYHTENTVFSNQNHFRIHKHVSEEQNIVLKSFLF